MTTESNAKDGGMLNAVRTEMETYPTGQMVDLLHPDPRTICIEDIAHHLSTQTRYNGAIKRFYSVAEHCCLVHDLLLSRDSVHDQSLRLPALMHDAAEAYLGDVVAPLKYAMRVEEQDLLDAAGACKVAPFHTFAGAYTQLTGLMEAAIGTALGVDMRVASCEAIRTMDMWALKVEARELTVSGGVNWRWPGKLPNEGLLPRGEPFEDLMWGLHPALAEAAFLERWYA